MNWILSRLQESSTWRGLVWLLTALGITVSPELADKIAIAGMALAGLIGIITKERAKKVEITLPPIDLVARSEPAACGVRDDALPPVRPSEVGAESRNGSGWNG
jgi:hypothetical protein